MKTIVLILMLISAVALVLAALMGLDILKTAIMNVSGTGFLMLSIACSLYAIGLHFTKLFGKGDSGA
ncbi:MAG: hypothetical protein A3F84_21300 [Candidatus Handelsmanbacteria bacterium RIFCSPLOWO2_12_FULL_64_10]|uniref:Uncharacterized protein n=1 Tax=Handelsmanbacteria sp. (strain RIFCSPLOWO2_12_FULL_64_10) TaxID=1817868 RepID=A0A1F6D4A7_HANXR|nr:MAG: hypothetical protein A3F84_21300 [Candidatus Handelsmanbacteria bacterium RIFCSPLOWO2_12_FULL_64_10]